MLQCVAVWCKDICLFELCFTCKYYMHSTIAFFHFFLETTQYCRPRKYHGHAGVKYMVTRVLFCKLKRCYYYVHINITIFIHLYRISLYSTTCMTGRWQSTDFQILSCGCCDVESKVRSVSKMECVHGEID